MLGIGAAFGEKATTDEELQGVLKVFYWWQFSAHGHITADIQLITGDGLIDESNFVLAPSLGAHFSF